MNRRRKEVGPIPCCFPGVWVFEGDHTCWFSGYFDPAIDTGGDVDRFRCDPPARGRTYGTLVNVRRHVCELVSSVPVRRGCLHIRTEIDSRSGDRTVSVTEDDTANHRHQIGGFGRSSANGSVSRIRLIVVPRVRPAVPWT